MTQITRHFVDIDGRQVHYRRAGQGPALLLIHQSPQNSRMWAEMIERYAPHFTVIAPDTPGFGYSDPLSPGPHSMAEFGQATFELVQALGLDRVAVFGMHTGGLVATWLAWAHPETVSALVVDGYAAFTPEESALYGDAYLPPFVPRWDGAHLRWLWSRIREQKYFFPWYDGRAEAAMGIAPATVQATHDAVMDVLDVGDHYRTGYGAAFAHNDHHWVSELKVPSLIVFRHGDPLLAHMPRLTDLPANVALVEEPGSIPAMLERLDTWLPATLANEPLAPEPPRRRLPSGWHRVWVATTTGEVAGWHHAGEGDLSVWLHAPGSAPLHPSAVTAQGATLLVDLPGHGASCETDAVLDVAAMVTGIRALIDAVAPNSAVRLQLQGAAAAYLPGLAAHLAERLLAAHLDTPWLLTADEQTCLLANLPRTDIDRAGGHMGDAWHWERERHLLWPWMPQVAAARRLVDAPAPEQVHANVVELLRLGPRLRPLLQAATPPDLAQQLRALRVPLSVQANPANDYQGRAAALLA
jgi:pimeloyl-ACP methyl ester carboxylesterase